MFKKAEAEELFISALQQMQTPANAKAVRQESMHWSVMFLPNEDPANVQAIEAESFADQPLACKDAVEVWVQMLHMNPKGLLSLAVQQPEDESAKGIRRRLLTVELKLDPEGELLASVYGTTMKGKRTDFGIIWDSNNFAQDKVHVDTDAPKQQDPRERLKLMLKGIQNFAEGGAFVTSFREKDGFHVGPMKPN